MDQNTIQHKTPFNTSLYTGQNGQEGVVLVRESDGDVIFLLDLFRYETGGEGGLLYSINLKDKYQFGYFSIFKIFIPFSDSYKLLHLSILSNTQRSSYKQWLMQQISYFANKENPSKESNFKAYYVYFMSFNEMYVISHRFQVLFDICLFNDEILWALPEEYTYKFPKLFWSTCICFKYTYQCCSTSGNHRLYVDATEFLSLTLKQGYILTSSIDIRENSSCLHHRLE